MEVLAWILVSCEIEKKSKDKLKVDIIDPKLPCSAYLKYLHNQNIDEASPSTLKGC